MQRLEDYIAYNTSIVLCIKTDWTAHVARKGRKVIDLKFWLETSCTERTLGKQEDHINQVTDSEDENY
jgi:hypothetical protein